jgi:hypothetical protein
MEPSATLMRHLGASGNTHEQSKPPANPQAAIERSTTPVKPDGTSDADEALKKRVSKLKPSRYGGFEQLRRDLHKEKAAASLAKSYPSGIPTGERTNDFDAADIIKEVKAMPKATIVSSTPILKSLEKTREALGKALAVDTRAAVEPSISVASASPPAMKCRPARPIA